MYFLSNESNGLIHPDKYHIVIIKYCISIWNTNPTNVITHFKKTPNISLKPVVRTQREIRPDLKTHK